MTKVQLKTQKNTSSVSAFLNTIANPEQRKDAKILLGMMKDITGKKPTMWGSSIVGFDTYHYEYDSGREGDFFIVGFSPRSKNLTIYIMPGYSESAYQKLLAQLGPHSLGKSCLYIKRLDDIDLSVLKKLITKGYREMKQKYP